MILHRRHIIFASGSESEKRRYFVIGPSHIRGSRSATAVTECVRSPSRHCWKSWFTAVNSAHYTTILFFLFPYGFAHDDLFLLILALKRSRMCRTWPIQRFASRGHYGKTDCQCLLISFQFCSGGVGYRCRCLLSFPLGARTILQAHSSIRAAVSHRTMLLWSPNLVTLLAIICIFASVTILFL